MASGAGTLVKLDKNNYFYNFGYEWGNLRSGRSFAASFGHKAYDVSDPYYLRELGDYLKKHSGLKTGHLFEAMLKILTQSDTRVLGELDKDAQTIVTDFIAVYTAELERHLMSNLEDGTGPWENDLAEATFVSSFVVQSGTVIKGATRDAKGEFQGGRLGSGGPVDWWAREEGTLRSGIGKTRANRRILTRMISKWEHDHHPKLVAEVESLLGGRPLPYGDVYEGVMEYLNNKETGIHIEGEKLTEAFVAFLMQVRQDVEKMSF